MLDRNLRLHKNENKHTIFISGPTASGKTDFSIKISKELNDKVGVESEIINADVGQFYTPISVGTAKPDWENMPVKHHLFDLLDEPEDLNVVEYRKMLIEKVERVRKNNKLPIVVGGSLFYIRSIFFPPTTKSPTGKRRDLFKKDDGRLWNRLFEIDPERANAIHKNDIYRIERALRIWEKTGKKPCDYKPKLDVPFNAQIIFINLPREQLYERINLRTKKMFDGWVKEARRLKNTKWEKFLKTKKLIGYPEIFNWIENGEKETEIGSLIGTIQQKTRNYAKRQITFWKKFRNILLDEKFVLVKDGNIETIVKG